MSKMPSKSRFDFRQPVSYDPGRKSLFHSHVRRQLKQLAMVLGLVPGTYDLRSNQGGIAVSGETILHAERLYVQVSQPALGFNSGILFRNCRGRRDYTGATNNFASLDLLHEPEKLAGLIWRSCHV